MANLRWWIERCFSPISAQFQTFLGLSLGYLSSQNFLKYLFSKIASRFGNHMFQHELREHKLVTLKETVQKVCSNKGADCPLPLFNWILDFKNTVFGNSKKAPRWIGKTETYSPRREVWQNEIADYFLSLTCRIGRYFRPISDPFWAYY
jgi:hypothetical protein